MNNRVEPQLNNLGIIGVEPQLNNIAAAKYRKPRFDPDYYSRLIITSEKP